MKPSWISNRKLTSLRKFKQKKYRTSERIFLAEGARAVQQIVNNNRVTVSELFFDESQSYWNQEPWNSLSGTIHSSIISQKDFASVSDTDNPQGVIALCNMPDEAEPEDLVGLSGLMIAIDAVQDPGNLGTIIRTASWFGVNGILSGKGTVDLFHPKVVRGTAGATGVIPHISGELSELLTFFEKHGWQIILLNVDASSMPLRKIEKQDKMIVVVGNEANGIDKSLFSPVRQKVRIDSVREPFVESLNAGVASAISFYVLSD